MGIQDRGYYQEEVARLAARDRAPTLLAIIGVTCAVSGLQAFVPGLTEAFLLRTGAEFRPWQPFTAMLIHADPWHLLFNMVFLFWLGRDVERIYGAVDTLFFYLFAGGLAGVVYVLTGIPNPALGASGGVMGVLVLCALYYPSKPMLLMFVFPMPLWAMAVCYVVLDAGAFIQFGEPSRVAHAAHLGGAAAGVLFRFVDLRPTRLFARRSHVRVRPRPAADAAPAGAAPATGRTRRRRGTSERLPENLPPVLDPVRAEELSDAALAEGMNRIRTDEILDKMHREGRAALTDDEAAFLERTGRGTPGSGGGEAGSGGVTT